MPFDVRDFPGMPPDERAASRSNRRLVALWLLSICGMILAMVVLGGVTRLAGAGLSIMEWAPISGALPPMGQAAWEHLFALYQQTPQYQLINHDMGLTGFKGIFWLEWTHRLWGRLIGAAFLLPLIWLWATGRIQRRLRPRLALIFILGGLQGAVGWFMVESGFFADRVSVAPARLVVHLALALLLYGTILWTALGLLWPTPIWTTGSGSVRATLLRTVVQLCAACLVLTMLAGGLVAGTHAGFEYNTFPLMQGHVVPENYSRLQPFWRNLVQNLATVQFNHRVLATLTIASAAAAFLLASGRAVPSFVKAMVASLSACIALQYALGVTTLLWVVPIPLAAAHQANAILALTAALIACHALRPVAAGRSEAMATVAST